MELKPCLITFLFLSGMRLPGFAQDTRPTTPVLPFIDSFVKKATANPFPSIGKWKDVKGEEFNFNEFRQPAIIRLGFRGCAPCKALMKSFIKMSELYTDVSFFYFTYDTNEEILEDISKLYPATGRVHFVSIPQSIIKDFRLAIGYPVTYFITPGNDVKAIDMLWMNRDQEIQYDKRIIDSLLRN